MHILESAAGRTCHLTTGELFYLYWP